MLIVKQLSSVLAMAVLGVHHSIRGNQPVFLECCGRDLRRKSTRRQQGRGEIPGRLTVERSNFDNRESDGNWA